MQSPKRWILSSLLAVALAVPGLAEGQTSNEVRDELLRHFNTSMRKMVSLAQAMPAETFTWSPMEGVMEVGHVYMHIARYNYLYPTENLGLPLPEGVDMEGMESVRDKEQVIQALERSADWVQQQVAALPEGALERPTRLYGREVDGWAVLVQLVSHMNEHVGQSIAYARMNRVVPPWSR